jgi:branched-chain amino acid transport system substrate-binding protein
MSRYLLVGVFALCLLLGAEALTEKKTYARQTSCVIRLGSAEPLTGKFATLAQQEVNGFRLWEREVNAAGGMRVGESLRCDVEIIVYDSENNKDLTRALYQKLVDEDGVDFLLGCYSSTHGRIASEVAEERNIPIVLAGSATDSIYQVSNQWTVGVLTPASLYYSSILSNIRLYDVKRVAWLSESAAFTRSVCGAITELAPGLGMEVVYSEVLPDSSTTNLTGAVLDSYLKGVIASEPDAFLSCAYLGVTTELAKLSRDLRFSPSVTGKGVR